MDTVSVLITDKVLGKNECCRCAVRCRPVDPNLPSVTLALIERQGDFALFLFSNLRQFVVEAADLKLDNILPVASGFVCSESADIHHESLGEGSREYRNSSSPQQDCLRQLLCVLLGLFSNRLLAILLLKR